MSERAEHRLLSWCAVTALAIYAVFLCASPFEHHDLSCELKTPQHCVACTSTVLGSDPDIPSVDAVCTLADAGRALPLDVRGDSLLLVARTPGRSPPPAA